MTLTPQQVTGRDDSHLAWEGGIGLLPECWEAFRELRDRAGNAGFDLQVASGFRSFERQLAIWNAKAAGERPVHDDAGRDLDVHALEQRECVHAILRYSALPGASRHHWGTDLDVFDAASLPEGYRVQLTPEEVAEDGPFGPMHAWLDEQVANGKAVGFYRPYDVDRGGVAVERWHLSFAPRAVDCETLLTEALLEKTLRQYEMVLGDCVLGQLPELFRRYVCAVSPAPSRSL